MSPEPTLEASKESLDLPSLNENVRIPAITEGEDENPYHAGYMLLADNLNDSELIISDDDDDENEEWTLPSTSSDNNVNVTENPQTNISQEVIDVWASNSNPFDIDLDSEKICQVKCLMASFTLPNSVIPEWASKISEEQWKEQLMEQIGKIKKRK